MPIPVPEPVPDPQPDPDPWPNDRPGIEGSNCAGATPVMTVDGVTYPFQSVAAYYWQVLEGYWTIAEAAEAGAEDEIVLSFWIPARLVGDAFVAWSAKAGGILREHGKLAFAHRYYEGIFGFLPTPLASTLELACTVALDEVGRRIGLLVHVALSQAGSCGTNDDGTTKFWQVRHIGVLEVNQRYDAYDLVAAGLAVGNRATQAVFMMPTELCILPAAGIDVDPTSPYNPSTIPCRVWWRADAVLEAAVFLTATSASVSGTPLVHRPFTAAGQVELPNGLDQVRRILRDGQLRTMWALGLPRFRPAPPYDPETEPERGPYDVILVGQRVGPAITPNVVLLPEEQSQVAMIAGDYGTECCRLECTAATSIDGATVAGSGAPPPTPPAPAGPGQTARVASDCKTVCALEGTCGNRWLRDGVVVMITSDTTADCFGSCPEPAASAPSVTPTCEPESPAQPEQP